MTMRWVAALTPGVLGIGALLIYWNGASRFPALLLALAAVCIWGLRTPRGTDERVRAPGAAIDAEKVKRYRRAHPGVSIDEALLAVSDQRD